MSVKQSIMKKSTFERTHNIYVQITCMMYCTYIYFHCNHILTL